MDEKGLGVRGERDWDETRVCSLFFLAFFKTLGPHSFSDFERKTDCKQSKFIGEVLSDHDTLILYGLE